MKALTLWQPWAHLVARGEKLIENRPWEPPNSLYGEDFAIHAGKKWDTSYPFSGPHKDAVVFGAIIAVCRVVCLVRSSEEAEKLHAGQGKWFVGPVGWVLSNIRPVARIPCPGRQKLWNLSPGQEAQVIANLESAAQFKRTP